jgi:hypothetical protein
MGRSITKGHNTQSTTAEQLVRDPTSGVLHTEPGENKSYGRDSTGSFCAILTMQDVGLSFTAGYGSAAKGVDPSPRAIRDQWAHSRWGTLQGPKHIK